MSSTNLKRRLPEIKSLAMLKMEKNFIALEKGYRRQPYTFYPPSFWVDKIKEELAEMEEALKKKNVTGMMEECADLSNVIDYFFELLLRFEFQNRKGVVKLE
jgi:hypothetical protein